MDGAHSELSAHFVQAPAGEVLPWEQSCMYGYANTLYSPLVHSNFTIYITMTMLFMFLFHF